jgi:hypothetical protein
MHPRAEYIKRIKFLSSFYSSIRRVFEMIRYLSRKSKSFIFCANSQVSGIYQGESCNRISMQNLRAAGSNAINQKAIEARGVKSTGGKKGSLIPQSKDL